MKNLYAKLRLQGLQVRLAFLVLVGFLPLFGLEIYDSFKDRRRTLDQAGSTVRRAAQLAEKQLAIHVQAAHALVHAMAANPILRGSNSALCSELLAAQLKYGEHYALFSLSGRDGELLCLSEAAAYEKLSVAERDYFRNAVELRRAVVGLPIVGRVSKKVVVPVAEPLLDRHGNVERVLMASLDLEKLARETSDVLPFEKIDIAYSDQEGRVLYQNFRNQRQQRSDTEPTINRALHDRQPGEIFEARGLDGRDKVYAFENSRMYPEKVLIIRAGIAREFLSAAANRELMTALLRLSIIAFGSLWVAAFIAKRFVRVPVLALMHASARMTAGDLTARIPESGLRGEFSLLANAFNRMAESLATQIAKVRESDEQLRLIMTSTKDHAIIMLDELGKVRFWNAGAERMSGYSEHEIIGQSISRFYTPEDVEREKPDELLRRAAAEGSCEEEGWQVNKEGSLSYVNVVLTAIRNDDGSLRGFAKITRDISERRQMEMASERFVADLQRSNKDLDQFAYVASHDLKAPLRAIDNLASWLAKDLGDTIPEASVRHLELLVGRIRRMERLLDDLLKYSRAGRVLGDIESINLNGLLADVLDLLSLPLKFHVKIGLRLPVIRSYRAPLREIFLNLINNAVKHHDQSSGEIKISCRIADGILSCTVTDDGPGIPAEYHERVFEMFETLKSRDEVEGSGMGLAVVKKTIESQGGSIRIESGDGRGTKILFTWPVFKNEIAAQT